MPPSRRYWVRRSPRTSADAWTERAFASLDQLDTDVHFQQILRFLETRLYDGRDGGYWSTVLEVEVGAGETRVVDIP